MKRYCFNCDMETASHVSVENLETVIDGEKIAFKGRIAKCAHCGEEIYDAELSDVNIMAANAVYRKRKDLISVEEINKLLQKYNIGKKPLALLLGWGEATLLRYFDGFTPRREYSEQLRELMNPYKMLKIYQQNKDKITNVAGNKLLQSINEEIAMNTSGDKVQEVAHFFLSKIDVESGEVITPLKLQKLVYYAQAWFLALFARPLFNDSFEAWKHGPVVRKLYFHYKEFGFNPLPKVDVLTKTVFTAEELSLLEMVNSVYCKYDARFLERMSHAEKPWIDARGGCGDGDICDNIIPENEIHDYFSAIVYQKDIKDAKGMERHIVDVMYS